MLDSVISALVNGEATNSDVDALIAASLNSESSSTPQSLNPMQFVIAHAERWLESNPDIKFAIRAFDYAQQALQESPQPEKAVLPTILNLYLDFTSSVPDTAWLILDLEKEMRRQLPGLSRIELGDIGLSQVLGSLHSSLTERFGDRSAARAYVQYLINPIPQVQLS